MRDICYHDWVPLQLAVWPVGHRCTLCGEERAPATDKVIADVIRAKMTSHNSIPAERCTMLVKEFALLGEVTKRGEE